MVPVGKWFAVNTWIATSLLVGWVFSGLLAVIVFGVDGEWGWVVTAYAATFLADVGFAALVVMVAVLSRSVAFAIAGVLVFLVFDTMLGWVLTAISWSSGLIERQWPEMSALVERIVEVKPWLPSSAYEVWTGYREWIEWDWRSFVSLAVITLVCMVISERVFNRIDVP